VGGRCIDMVCVCCKTMLGSCNIGEEMGGGGGAVNMFPGFPTMRAGENQDTMHEK
jgi:hypothetical protein